MSVCETSLCKYKANHLHCTDLCCCEAEEESCKMLPVINMLMTFVQLFSCGFRYFISRINKNASLSDFDLWRRFYLYEGCSNMNASSFITFFTYMLRQNVIPIWKELFVTVKMAPNIKKHSLYFSSYRPLYKRHSCILKFFWNKLKCTFCYMCG